MMLSDVCCLSGLSR